MTADNTARDVLERLPGWARREASISALDGGLNNRSYRVRSGRQSFVLRIADELDDAGVRDHELELTVQQMAAGQGLAAQVVFADPGSGLMLTEFLPGRTWAPADLRERENLRRLATLLRRLHRLPRCGVAFDAVAIAGGYAAAIERAGELPAMATDCLAVVAEAAAGGELCCCHNDVVAENLIDGDALKLIDFEYARDNDPLFDLASVIGWHNLADREAGWLLDAYAGQSSAEWRERLAAAMRRFDALQWLWLAARIAQRRESAEERQMARVAARLRL